MAIELALVDNRVVAVVCCNVCKRQIESYSDGIVLFHDVGGLAPPKVWFSHRRCMGPCTGSISIQDFIKRLARSVGLSALLE